MLNTEEMRNLDTWSSTPKVVNLDAGSKPGERDSRSDLGLSAYALGMSRLRSESSSSVLGWAEKGWVEAGRLRRNRFVRLIEQEETAKKSSRRSKVR